MASLSKLNNRRNGDVFVTRLSKSTRPTLLYNDVKSWKTKLAQKVSNADGSDSVLKYDRTKFISKNNLKDNVTNNGDEKVFVKRLKPFQSDSSVNSKTLPRVKSTDSRWSRNSVSSKKYSDRPRPLTSGRSAVERKLLSASSRDGGQSIVRSTSVSSLIDPFATNGTSIEHRLKHVTINMTEQDDSMTIPASRLSTPLSSRPSEKDVSSDEDDFQYSDEEDSTIDEVLSDPYGDGTAVIYNAACRQMKIIPSTTFQRCYHLRSAMLNYQGLTSKGTRAVCLALVSNAIVSELLLAGNAIGTYGLECIVGMLKHNKNIKLLDVSDNDLQSAGAVLLADLIKNTNLVTLKASSNHFRGSDAKSISEALQKNTTLKHLDLSHNEFTEEGGVHLGHGLGENECLESVNLSWNHMRLEGISGIANGIRVNVNIKYLNVSWNGIGNEGARVLGRALRDNWVLQELDVSSSRIGFEGLKLLFAGMVGNETLKRLSLTKNPITSGGACLAIKLIQSTPSLQIEKLEMCDLSVTSECLDLLVELKKTRPNFEAVFGGVLRHKDMLMDAIAKHRDIRDPLEILMEFMKQNNLRLMDIFTRFDKDKSSSISRIEFERGIKDAAIPMDRLQLDKLINKLDYNGDGEIDFGELIEGYHLYIQRQRKKRKNSTNAQSVTTGSFKHYANKIGSRQYSPVNSNPNSRPVTPYRVNLSGPLGNRDEFIMSLRQLPANKNHFLNVTDMDGFDANMPSSDSDSDSDVDYEIQVPQMALGSVV